MKTLANGAQVLLEGIDRNDEDYCLCILEHGFATWAVDKDGNCYWGHYYSLTLGGLIDAVRDYRHRIGYQEDGTPIEEVKQP
ncbi:hypothetical protein ES708_14395 [subsurface metagenome]